MFYVHACLSIYLYILIYIYMAVCIHICTCICMRVTTSDSVRDHHLELLVLQHPCRVQGLHHGWIPGRYSVKVGVPLQYVSEAYRIHERVKTAINVGYGLQCPVKYCRRPYGDYVKIWIYEPLITGPYSSGPLRLPILRTPISFYWCLRASG